MGVENNFDNNNVIENTEVNKMLDGKTISKDEARELYDLIVKKGGKENITAEKGALQKIAAELLKGKDINHYNDLTIKIGDVLFNAIKERADVGNESKKEINNLKNNVEKGFTTKEVIATAYYGPLKGQSIYATGSYEGDIKLQGPGKKTASGVIPQPGMIAAPGNYKFGTNIILPQEVVNAIGINNNKVKIQDRGGAIVNAGERGYSKDRIDIFFGHGENALRKALVFGKKPIDIKILNT